MSKLIHIAVGYKDSKGDESPSVLYVGHSRGDAREAQDNAKGYGLTVSGLVTVQKRRVNEVATEPQAPAKPATKKATK